MATNQDKTTSDFSVLQRWVNLVIGVWLFISAFVWPHTTGAEMNTWILGILITLASVWAMFQPNARYVNTALAIWLFFATLIIGYTNPATGWNNLIAAVVVFVLSLIPSSATHFRPHAQFPAHA